MSSEGWEDRLHEFEKTCEKNIRLHPERKEHYIEADPNFILWAIKRINTLEYQEKINCAKITAQAKVLDNMRDAMRESCRDDRSQQLGGCPLLHDFEARLAEVEQWISDRESYESEQNEY